MHSASIGTIRAETITATSPHSIGKRETVRMSFSTDYPFERMEDASDWFDKTPLSDAERLQIGRTNAIKLFKLNLK